jgi:uncharacterized protein (UPF0248 family)
MGLFDLFSQNYKDGHVSDPKAFIDKYKIVYVHRSNGRNTSYQQRQEAIKYVKEIAKYLLNNQIPCRVEDIIKIQGATYYNSNEISIENQVRSHILEWDIYHNYWQDFKGDKELSSKILVFMAVSASNHNYDRLKWLQEARAIYPNKGEASIAMRDVFPQHFDAYQRYAVIDNLVSLTNKSLPAREAFQWALFYSKSFKSVPFREEVLLEIFRIVITKSSYKSSDFQNVSLTTNEKMEFFMEILDHINDGHFKKTSKIISAIERVIYEFNLLQANSYNLYFDNYIPDIIGRFDHNDYSDSYVKTFITYARSKNLI